MLKIYLQNPEKTQIQVFETENQIGASYQNWNIIDGQELADYIQQNELQELKKAKKQKFEELVKAYYVNTEKLIINITFNGRTEYLELLNRSSGIDGLKQALGKIQNDVALSEASDPILPLKYQGIERMYYIYVPEFSRNYAMNVIIMKQSKRQELITFFQNAITQYTVEYESTFGNNVQTDVYTSNYVKFFVYWEYKEQLDALTTIEELQAFTFEFTPLTLTLPEEYIENVQYNDY